jgi:outer membrane protein TolC
MGTTNLAATLALVLGLVLAATAPHAQGPALRIEPRAPGLTLADAVDAAAKRAPQAGVFTAVGEEAKAWRGRAEGLLGAAPSGFITYYGDQMTDNDGNMELDAGVNLPIWNWGQRSSADGVASATGREAEAFGRALRLEVAGLVRESVWEVRLAENRVEAAREALDAARKLAESVDKRVRNGDLPRADALLTGTDVKAKETALVEAETGLADAFARYQRLTGLDRLPQRPVEGRATVAAVPDSHPALTAAAARVGRETAQLDWTRASGAGNPNVSLGVRRQRDDRNAPYANQLMLGVALPFGTERYVAPGVAERARSRAEAQASAATAARELALALDQAARRLAAGERALALTREQAELAQELYRVNERAFAAGEIDLFTLLRIQNGAQAARSAARERAIQWNRDVARYNQAAGVLP